MCQYMDAAFCVREGGGREEREGERRGREVGKEGKSERGREGEREGGKQERGGLKYGLKDEEES